MELGRQIRKPQGMAQGPKTKIGIGFSRGWRMIDSGTAAILGKFAIELLSSSVNICQAVHVLNPLNPHHI